MQTYKDKLGKASITVEQGYWNINKDYDKLTVVEKEGIFGTFLSRKPVPAGTPLTNRTYWIPFSSLKEEIIIAYQEWVNKYGGIIESETAILNSIQQVMNDVYKHLPQGIYVEGNIDCIEQGSEDDLILNFGTTNNKNGDFSVYINDILYGTYKNIKNKELTLNIHEDTVVRIECTQNGYTFIGSWNVACLYPSYIGYGLTYEDVLENDNLKIDTKIDITGFYSVIANVEDGFIFICVPKDKLVSNILMNGYNIPMEEPVIVRNSENIEYKIYKSINSYELKDYIIYIGDYVDDTKTKLDEVLTRLDQIDDLEGNGEDINTNNNNQLQFADRAYNAQTPNGMGYVILRKDKTFAEQVADKPNTIFEIRYDFVLDSDVIIPADCVLYFNGGSLSGEHTLTGNNTCISAQLVRIFGSSIVIAGVWNVVQAYPEWFFVDDWSLAINLACKYFNKTILTSKYNIVANSNNVTDGVLIKIPQNHILQSVVDKSIYEPNAAILDVTCDVDCAIIETSSNVCVKNVTIKVIKDTQINVIGIYTHMCSCVLIENCKIHYASIGVKGETFVTKISKTYTYGCDIGFNFERYGTRGSSTSILLENCWVTSANKQAYLFNSVVYSQLQSCAADNCALESGHAYEFNDCGQITLTSCGCETCPQTVKVGLFSREITFISCLFVAHNVRSLSRAIEINGAGQVAFINTSFAKSSNDVFPNDYFYVAANYDSASNIYKYAVLVQFENCTFANAVFNYNNTKNYITFGTNTNFSHIRFIGNRFVFGPSSYRDGVNIGDCFFDETLNIPIWQLRNGTWVDANGQTPGKHSGELADLPDFLSGTAGANDDGYQFTFTDDATYGDKTVWWNSNAGNGGAWVDANGTVVITNP